MTFLSGTQLAFPLRIRMLSKVIDQRIVLEFSIFIIIAFNKISSVVSTADTGFYTIKKETRQIKHDIIDVVPTKSASQTECILTCRRQLATDIFYVEEENNCYCIVNKKNSIFTQKENETSNLVSSTGDTRSIEGNSYQERKVRQV